MAISDNYDNLTEYIRDMKVPTGMPSCQHFVDVMAQNAAGGNLNINAVVKAQAAALLEIINDMGKFSEAMRDRR